MDQFLKEFRQTVASAQERLLAMSAEAAGEEKPGKWSPKEIVGHLVDSAANNHQRFVRAQFTNDLVCNGYDQEAWVSSQHYQDASWPDLVNLWAGYNMHLLHFISVMPVEILTRVRARHNLDKMAWQAVDKNTPTTLEYFVRDYAGHMRHHLKQILGKDFGNSTSTIN